MKRTLYLHIGAHRTATTSVQEFLFNNFIPLMINGILYPFRMKRHISIVNNLFSGERTIEEIAMELVTIADDKPDKIDKIILSDEDICQRNDLSILAQFRECFDVKIIFSLRRQDLWLESWYTQNIKWQWNKELSHLTFDDFMAKRDQFHWIDYDTYIGHLESLFGRENILLPIFESEQMPNGPVTNFCAHVGLTDLSGYTNIPHMNAKLSPQMVEFMRYLPLDEADNHTRSILLEACENIDQKSGRNLNELYIPHRERSALMERYETGNRAVANRYFNRDALFLEPLPPKDASLADMHIPGGYPAIMQKFAGPMVSELIQHGNITSPINRQD